MFTQAELNAILSAGIVLIILAICINIYWILNGWQIDAIRRAFARWVLGKQDNHRIENYIEGLRKLVEDEEKLTNHTSHYKPYRTYDTEQITFNRKKARN